MNVAIIDSNALAHIVKHSTKELSFRGSNTGVIYGFIKKLFSIQDMIQADKVIFTWDSLTELNRKKVYPNYKKNRTKNRTEKDIELDKIAKPQFSLLRKEVLPAIGFYNQFIFDGLEADDIIAQIVNQYKDYKLQIVSRDNDLFQLLEKGRVSIFDPVKMGWITEKIFFDKWRVNPSDWEMVKSISGCKSDNVEGVKGVKELTAIKFLKGELKATSKVLKKIIDSQEICIRNIRLVKLPWENTPRIDIIPDDINIDGFISICQKYGFKSLIDDINYGKFEYLFIKNRRKNE